VADELDRFLAGSPIVARPVSGLELAWRWGRKHPAVPALIGTVGLALVVTAGVFYSSARSIEQARAMEMAARLAAEQARAMEMSARLAAEESLYAATLQMIGSGDSMLGGVDLADLRKNLRATRPAPGARDLRGFEWRYYWLRNQGEAIAALRGHRHIVDQTLFSPDESLIATHSVDGEMKLWNATAVRERHSLPGVARIGGFVAGGQRLIFSRKDNSIWQLDVASLQAVQLLQPAGRLIGVQPDGRHAVVFGSQGLPVLHSLDSNAIPEMQPEEGEGPAALSADGATAVVTTIEKGEATRRVLVVVDLVSGKERGRFVDDRPLTALALTANGSEMVSAGFDGVLKIWDVAGGIQKRAFRAFLDPVWGMAFSPDGQTFAAGGNNRELKSWSTSDWTEEPVVYAGHGSTINFVAFSPDGERLVSGGDDDLALVWSTKPNRPLTEMPQLLRGPKWADATPSLAFSPDSRFFAGTAADGTIKVWRSDTAECVVTIPTYVRSVEFARNGDAIIGKGYDGTIRQWQIDGRQSGELVSKPGPFQNWQLATLSSEQRVALVAEGREARTQCAVYEIPSARDAMINGAPAAAATIAISPDGNTMFIGTPQGSVEVWDVATRKMRFSFTSHRVGVSAIAISWDGRYLATGSLDNFTKLWDAATGELLATYGSHNRPIWALAFSPDGRTLAAGSCDKQIILCSVPLRRAVGTLTLYVGIPAGFEQEVRLLRFSHDGDILAAALGDGTVRFFRAASFSETDRAEN
jgi:WD40 repeat protein